MKKEVKLHKKYTIEVITYTDGTSTIKRNNKGFSVVELLGLMEIAKTHLINVFKDCVQKADKENLKSSDSPIIHPLDNTNKII